MRKSVFLLCLFSITLLFLGWRNYWSPAITADGYTNMSCFMKSWNEHGLAACKGAPCYTFGAPGDRFLPYFPGPIDESGKCYYTSFPPFSFILTYYYLKAVPFVPQQTALLWLNLILQLAVALLVMLLTRFLLRKAGNFSANISALSSYSLILFTPISFHFFTTYYFIENGALVFWCLATYAGLLYFNSLQSKTHITRIRVFFLCSLALLCYTELIGYFLAAALMVVIYLKANTIENYKKELAAILGVTLFIALVTFLQYSSINGTAAFLFHIKTRLVGRSGWFGESYSESGMSWYSLALYKNAWALLQHGFLPLLLLLIAYTGSISIRKGESTWKHFDIATAELLLLVVPYGLHTLLFINANLLHEQLIVKAIVPLSVLCGVRIAKLNFQNERWFTRGNLLLVLALLISALQTSFLFLELPFETEQQKIGAEIKNKIRPTQTPVLKVNTLQHDFGPNLFYYSGRNIALVKDNAALDLISSKIPSDSLVVWQLDEDWKIKTH